MLLLFFVKENEFQSVHWYSVKMTEVENDMKDVFFQITVNGDNNINDDMGLHLQKDIELLFSVTIFDSDFILV